MLAVNPLNTSVAISNIKLTNNGYVISQNKTIRNYGGSNLELSNTYMTSVFTVSSITSIRIIAQSSYYIGIGSRFQLYKSGSQEVKSWVTT